MARARFHAFVEGEVQMVGFRVFAADWANSLRVTGWVRNTPDGQVEILAEGDELDLQTFLDYLGQGPRAARVNDIKVEWEPPTRDFTRFSIRM